MIASIKFSGFEKILKFFLQCKIFLGFFNVRIKIIKFKLYGQIVTERKINNHFICFKNKKTSAILRIVRKWNFYLFISPHHVNNNILQFLGERICRFFILFNKFINLIKPLSFPINLLNIFWNCRDFMWNVFSYWVMRGVSVGFP